MKMQIPTGDQPKSVRIAVPYYGALVRPDVGLERIFFIAEAGRLSGEWNELGLRIWNPKETPRLAHWLRRMGVGGVICSDRQFRYEEALTEEGIWVCWEQEGDPGDVIARWANGLAA